MVSCVPCYPTSICSSLYLILIFLLVYLCISLALQVHTTGMDIAQALNATAVVTLGKDMTFRDYAQVTERMATLFSLLLTLLPFARASYDLDDVDGYPCVFVLFFLFVCLT